jgi:hypothetical protein
MTDNTTLNPGASGDVIRTVDRALNTPPSPFKTQVVQLDFGGEAGPESLATSANPLPTIDPATDAARNNDVPLATMLVGDPAGPFAGVNLLEAVIEDGTGIGVNVKIINPPKQDIQGGLFLSDAPAPILINAPVGASVIIDTPGAQSLHLTTQTLAGTVTHSNDLITWQALNGSLNTGGIVTAVAANSGYSFPCLSRYIKITPTTAGTATAYLRAQPFQGMAVFQNVAFLGSTAVVNAGVGGTLAVGGNVAAGVAPTLNPIGAGGVDSAGLVRRLLTDTSGRVQSASIGVDAQGVQRQAGVTTPYTAGAPAALTFDIQQFEGQSITELLGLILQELRIANQQRAMASANNDSVPIGDPMDLRGDSIIFNQ